MDTVITIPQGTYPVTYAGTLEDGEILEIPELHQRRGDTGKNKLVSIVFQNTAYDGAAAVYLWYLYPVLQVLDADNVAMSDIYWPNAWQLPTDERMRIKAQFATAPGAFPYFGEDALLRFKIVAFYRRPDEG